MSMAWRAEGASPLIAERPAPEGSRSLSGPGPWLFSAPVDLAAFLGSALLALLALVAGAQLGILHQDTPDWAWVPFVLLIDVAHVWATAFRVYFDPEELRRRPLLYTLVPAAAFVLGVALYSEGSLLFWRVLAYLAVFHFVRQQYGWVALYRARLGERDAVGRWIDTATIYLATVYPLVWWHANLPRHFWWLERNDWRVPGGGFLATALPILAELLQPIWCAALVLYTARSVQRWLTGRANPGKDIVVATTVFCWYVGIVWFNSDYAFTVTNVIIHGVPYFVLVWWYWQKKRQPAGAAPWSRTRSAIVFVATLWLLAYVEELFWHRAVREEHRRWLFGEPWEVGGWKMILVPLLAVPQITHYVLDGFIWRRRSNPEMATFLGARPAQSP